jgi:hypothetical protein
MMNAIGSIFGIVCGLALLVALAAGGYMAFHWGLDLFGTLEPQVATITAIASMVAVLCAAIIAGGFKWMGRKEKEVAVRAEKANLYERMMLIWGEKLKQGTKALEPSLEEELHAQERLLTLRGSANVLKAYLALQRQANTVGLRSPELASFMAKLILDMRRDLCVSVLNVNERDLVAVLQGGEVEEQSSSFVQAGRPPVALGRGI